MYGSSISKSEPICTKLKHIGYRYPRAVAPNLEHKDQIRNESSDTLKMHSGC